MNVKGKKKKNQVAPANIFEQQELLKKAEVIRESLTASTWHELETNGKFDKNKKLSFISDDMLIIGCDVGSENSQLKDDTKDPKLIANLVKDGNFGMPYLPEALYAELRRLSMSRIRHRGPKRLRYRLFQGAKSAVDHAEEFKELHRYYTTRADNPLKKMQSLIVIACKLLRIIYTILKNGTVYDLKKMLMDIRRQEKMETAAA